MKKLILILISIPILFLGCEKEKDTSIKYPETGEWGENMLFKENTEYTTGPNTNYSIYAILGKDAKLKIECINWSGFSDHDNSGWDYYLDNESGNFIVETYRTGEVERRVSFNKHNENESSFIYYYENNDTVPSYIKEIFPK